MFSHYVRSRLFIRAEGFPNADRKNQNISFLRRVMLILLRRHTMRKDVTQGCIPPPPPVCRRLTGLFCACLGIFFAFTTCKAPMGLGDSIDWEAPVLTIDPGSNPRYVRLGTTLEGTVTDNVGVSSVIMRDAVSGKELFQAEVTGNRWKINLNFSEEQNGEKIVAEIVSYDRARNSNDQSMVSITLIIDIRPPITEDMSINRTPMKTARLETYSKLMELETTDPRGEKSANVDNYQNGWFHLKGKVSEEETRIEVVSLNIYDAREPDTLLLSLERLPDSSAFSPLWLIKEEDIINAGEAVFQNYRTNYYDNNERYYYRVAITAIDRSGNENEVRTEDEGFFCMWVKGDEPKGVFDPVMGTVVARGTPLPVEFFDDDQLGWAYSALFTKAQWDGVKPVADNDVFVPGGSGEQKLTWLKENLIAGKTIYNWRLDKYNGNNGKTEPLKELIGDAERDNQLVYIPTGNQELDYGEFVLITLASDRKVDPHTGNGPEVTNKNTWKGRSWNIQIIDDSAPIIVFDTVITTDSDYDVDKHTGGEKLEFIPAARTGDSPEENTFPKLTDGRYFEINGYTLRENSSMANTVQKFRMAWIPFEISGVLTLHL